jgi:hypothetical protein
VSTLITSPNSVPTAAAQPASRPTARPKTQGVFSIWHGLNVSGWRKLKRSGAPLSRKYWFRHATISALSWLNSANEALESLLLGRAVARTQIAEPPLFVLGHWRSGTTLLHNLITLDPQFAFPNLYHTLFPGHFLLTERVVTALTGWLIPKTRPMDNVPAGWQMPQEDEVALLLRTQVSPYLMLAFQGQREKYGRFFDLEQCTTEELNLWIREFLLFIRKLSWLTGKPIVLKSPSHTYRIPLLLDLFPNARFAYIYRDPYAIYSSTVHLRRSVFTENALAEPNFVGSEDDALLSYTDCIRRYEATKHLIPAGQLHELRFEDLEADPLGEMRTLYDRLKLSGWEELESRIRQQMADHAAYRKNRFELDAQTKQMVYDRCRDIFERYGYPSRLPDASEERAA